MKRILLTLFIFCAGSTAISAHKYTVTYVRIGGRQAAEDTAVLSWLKHNAKFSMRTVSLVEATRTLDPASVIWMHLTDSTELQKILVDAPFLSTLRTHYSRGGKILCTDYAAMLPYYLGIESKKPELRSDSIQNDWLFDKRGFQGFRGHPLFSGLQGGEYVWDPNEDQVLPFIGYFGNEFPANGKVAAVDKAYVFVYMQRRIVVEYGSNVPRCIAVGSSVYFGRGNNLRQNLGIFIENALQYLSGRRFAEKSTFWEHYKNVPKEFAVRTSPIQQSKKGENERAFATLPTTKLVLRRENARTEFFDVAGRRALVMGKENGGIDEIWIHPFRVVRDYQAGIVSGDSVAWLSQFPVIVSVRPESFTRTYTLPGGTLREIVFASLHRAGAIVHYDFSAAAPLSLVIRLRTDARWMWPYDANTLGDLHYGYDDGLKAMHVTDTSGAMYALFGADASPRAQVSGQFESIRCDANGFQGVPTKLNQVYHAASFELNNANHHSLNYVVVGGSEGRERALDDFRILAEQPFAAYIEQVHHYEQLLQNSLQIASPNKEFDELFQWSIVGTDRFVAKTPGIGEGLLAGFSTTARGWNGEHKNSGRPGYAWYFGRDAVWSGYAIDDYGCFELVKKQLELFQKFQAPSGKIYHEMSTSGIVHYDAADATPLYLTLAGHYLRASGDAAFIKQSWPSLKKAMDFLYSTDTDHDGFIENTNQGHGWVEGGALFGAHSTLYLNASWVQVLKDMSDIATLMGKNELSLRYRSDAERVRRNINTQFWNDSTQFFNFGRYANGSYQTEPTILPAVGAYWSLYDEAKVKPMLEAYAGNGFTTNWGVRILSSSSPLFNPGGYHYGSVWPLFTGWAALAEYEYGNSTQGFAHIWENIFIKKHWALGFVQEVMSGAVYRPSGICPHQCWS
ncbi:MAG: GH116 family glycosyl hydrolase [Ignavibacteriales bacterium]|nr:GH116 family glycosyl hydrolase [Ignavibacteriales bacterium]